MNTHRASHRLLVVTTQTQHTHTATCGTDSSNSSLRVRRAHKKCRKTSLLEWTAEVAAAPGIEMATKKMQREGERERRSREQSPVIPSLNIGRWCPLSFIALHAHCFPMHMCAIIPSFGRYTGRWQCWRWTTGQRPSNTHTLDSEWTLVMKRHWRKREVLSDYRQRQQLSSAIASEEHWHQRQGKRPEVKLS